MLCFLKAASLPDVAYVKQLMAVSDGILPNGALVLRCCTCRHGVALAMSPRSAGAQQRACASAAGKSASQWPAFCSELIAWPAPASAAMRRRNRYK